MLTGDGADDCSRKVEARMSDEDDRQRPRVRLVGRDGNAFAVLAACMKAAREFGWSAEQIEEFRRDATSGNYDNLLAAAMKYFDVE